MFKRKKKKTGSNVPLQDTLPSIPPVKTEKENVNNLRIKTLESIRIEVGENGISDTACIEVSGLETAISPTMSIKSSSVKSCSCIDDRILATKSVSFRDAFVPGATMYLVGIFEDWITGELVYGEYDVLNYKFTKKEITK